jgi:adenosine kinase
MSIVVTGSLAYDYIMDFPGYFKDHILPEKAHILSVSFLVDSMQKMRGGVAGNIAYNIALLGEPPKIVGAVGEDFDDYRTWMNDHGVDTNHIKVIPNESTSSCFITTDKADNQIVAFYAGAMPNARELTLGDKGFGENDLVLISPSDSEAMKLLALDCQRNNIPYIFDPGKQTPRMEPEQIHAGLVGARVLIGNDYEFGMMARLLEMSEEELIKKAPMTVITRGEQGSTIYVNSEDGGQTEINIPLAKIHEVRDPTGAGDAYLGGFAFGLVRGFPLEVTGRIAALSAVYAIEKHGCQEHQYTLQEFVSRYKDNFGTNEFIESLVK